MLTNIRSSLAASPAPGRQRGMVLLIALIVLAVMTLTALGLVRSVDTASILAGNLAFQQSAVRSGDVGTEAAISWLQTNNTGTTLHANSVAGLGYMASRQDPAAGQTWDAFWTISLAPANLPATLATDGAGNTVSYVIHRLCAAPGDPTTVGTGCSVSPVTATSTSSSKGGGTVALLYSSQVYYRITARIAGPRRTVSYVQTVVAM